MGTTETQPATLSEKAQEVLDFLIDGGYSCVLMYSEAKRRAYIDDEDEMEDEKTKYARVSVAVVRELIAADRIRIWRRHDVYEQNAYNAYRQTAWVEAWNNASDHERRMAALY